MVFLLFTEGNKGVWFDSNPERVELYESEDISGDFRGIVGAVSSISIVRQKGVVYEQPTTFLRTFVSPKIPIESEQKELCADDDVICKIFDKLHKRPNLLLVRLATRAKVRLFKYGPVIYAERFQTNEELLFSIINSMLRQ